jgi:hypothetical protein
MADKPEKRGNGDQRKWMGRKGLEKLKAESTDLFRGSRFTVGSREDGWGEAGKRGSEETKRETGKLIDQKRRSSWNKWMSL